MTRKSYGLKKPFVATIIMLMCAFFSCATTMSVGAAKAIKDNQTKERKLTNSEGDRIHKKKDKKDDKKENEVAMASNSPENPLPDVASPNVPPNIAFAQKLRALLNDGDINGAIALFDTADPTLLEDADLLILKASLLISAQRFPEASALVKDLLAKYPKNPDVLDIAMTLYTASGDTKNRNTLVTQVLKADPNNPTANIIQANGNILAKKWKLAKRNFQNALRGDGKNTQALFGLAQMCYYTDDLKMSRKVLDKLVSIDPENATAYQYIGKLYAEDENYKCATESVQKAISIDNSVYEYYLDLGQYLRSQGKYSDAEAAWTKAIELSPNYFLPYAYRAGLYDEQNKFKEALKDYNKVIETNPKYYFAYEEIGILEFHMGNYPQARACFMKADSIRSTSAYQLMATVCYLLEKDMANAKAYSEKSMKGMDRASLDYKMMRLFHDLGPGNAENALINDIDKEQNRTDRGRFMFYMGMYYKIKGIPQITEEYFGKIIAMQAPLFFEYRFAEWELNAAK